MLWSDSLFDPSQIYVEIVSYVENFHQASRNWFPFGARSDRTSEWNSKKIPSQVFLFAFAGALELLLLRSSLEFSRRRLGINSVWRPLDRLLDLISPEIPSWGFLLVFPRWVLLWLFVHEELHFPPLGVYSSSPFLGNYMSYENFRYFDLAFLKYNLHMHVKKRSMCRLMK